MIVVRRARAARAPPVAVRRRHRRPGARPADAAAARRARVRARLLTACAHAGHLARHASLVALARVRAAARDARLHRPRDGREPRRGGAAARASTCPARSSAASRRWSRSTSRSRSSRSRRSPGPSTELGTTLDPGAAARRRATASAPSCRAGSATPLRFYVGVTGALILLAAVTTSISGLLAARVLAGRARPAATQLRPPEPPCARLAARDRLGRADLVGDRDRDRVLRATTCEFLASLFSFGVLLAFTAAQLAVIKLRIDEPDLPRPYRAPFNVSDPAARRSRCRRSSARSLTFTDLGDRARDAPRRPLRRAGSGSRSVSSSSSPCGMSHGEGLMEKVIAARRAARRDGARASQRSSSR